jgi:hypothetical protein
MPEPEHPFQPPASDITLASDDVKKPAIPHETKVMLVIGILSCAGWPLYFGSMLIGRPWGTAGLFALVLVLSVITWSILSAHPRRFHALAVGLLILGLLSLFPFLPVMLGIFLHFLINRLPDDDGSTVGLSPVAAVIMTVLYAATYIGTALGVGTIIQAFRDPERMTRRSRRPPTS